MVDKVRVLIVDLSKRFGGASTRSISLAQGLRSWDATICGLEGSPVVEMAKRNNIPVITVAKSRIDPLIPFRLATHIRREGFQVIDTQNVQSKFWGSFAALLANKALISTLNSWYLSEHGDNIKGKIYTAIDLGTNWKTKRYIVVSEAVKKSLSRSGIPEKNIDLIRNAIDVNNTFSIQPKDFRKKHNLPHDAFIYVAVGRLVWAKGYEDFIQAFSRVAKKFEKIYAIVVGDGILFEKLQNQILQLGISDRMFLLGLRDRDEVLDILHCSDIFVMSSRSEGIPYALLEAAAIGLPIIATACGGIPEVVTDRKEALLVPVGDVSALSSALVSLYKDPVFSEKLGRNAKKRINQDFSLSAQISATKQSYLNAIK